ncbi:hypothetical protein GYMLUDRAFT_264755 [Collybiopsis luxurians FD-317 M1]|uniref:Cytochrome P450 n=1 Tax=Collybiopsis luxurians FD-317 M1 TaxID=944289 RepID=A0A0D0BH83_9AGAR|nr:hypothetical protein GYMLUDRAFT_264755 [Collybiopsis luxurians FD-317 M1]
MNRKYGSDIIHLGALGKSIVILNSATAISDLLEKRSSIYSSRPHSTMLVELMGWGNTLPFMPYNDAWKAQRKIFHQAVPPSDIARFHSKLLQATHNLVPVLARTDDYKGDLHSWIGVMMLDVVYGIQAEEAEDFLPLVEKAITSLGIAGAPGAFYVDQIPFLKYIPEWFPGADFKRKAKEWNLVRARITEDTFRTTKEQIASSTASPSLVSVALDQMDDSDDVAQREAHLKEASLSAFAGSSDTTVIALLNFLVAMLLNPDIQAKAHSELDKVLGPGDLPNFSDKPSLPYITAVVLETLRYRPVTPLAFPHLLTQDDIYEGYFIPKGTIVMGNAWSILQNEEDYPEPTRFNPSRFLNSDGKIDPNVRDPTNYAFGFGRRACPGKHLTLDALFIAVACILTCYTIEPELDEYGKPIKQKIEWNKTPTLVANPLPFKCRFVPRSKMEAVLGM